MNNYGRPFNRLSKILVAIPVLLIDLYRKGVSPFLGHRCRFTPTCSQYGREAFLKFGLFRGALMIVVRLSKCQPWGSFGYDPVVKGENISVRSQQ